MSRTKKKPAAVAGALSSEISDWDDFDQRQEKVLALWREAGTKIGDPTPQQLEDLTLNVSAYVAQPRNKEKNKLDEAARAAMKTLLAWCRYDPNDNGLPHINFRDRRVVALEAAITSAQPLAEGILSREWVNRAWDLWFRVKRITESQGKRPAYKDTSHAVVFISLILMWVGHPAAKPGAISMELRTKPDFRDKLI